MENQTSQSEIKTKFLLYSFNLGSFTFGCLGFTNKAVIIWAIKMADNFFTPRSMDSPYFDIIFSEVSDVSSSSIPDVKKKCFWLHLEKLKHIVCDRKILITIK